MACGFESRHRHHVVAKPVLRPRLFMPVAKRRHPPAPLLLLSNCNPLRWARSWCVALWAAFLGNGKISILTASSLRLLILRKTCLLPAKELYSSYPPMGDMRRLKIYGAPSRHTRNYPPSVTSNRTFGSGPQDGGRRTGLQRSFNTACRCKIRN